LIAACSPALARGLSHLRDEWLPDIPPPAVAMGTLERPLSISLMPSQTTNLQISLTSSKSLWSMARKAPRTQWLPVSWRPFWRPQIRNPKPFASCSDSALWREDTVKIGTHFVGVELPACGIHRRLERERIEAGGSRRLRYAGRHG